jgi:nucleotide-binding universal stress UspA family protein
MRENGLSSYKKILLAVDGSSSSKNATAHALHLAKADDAELVAINVAEDVKQGGAIGLRAKYGDVNLAKAFQNVQIEAGKKIIAPIVEACKEQGIKIRSEVILSSGKSEADAITDYAVKNGIDLIVLGSHGTSKLRKFLAGSVTGKLVNIAKCAVLVVP